MPTVVLNLTQKISAIIRPLRQSLPSERSLRSAHRLSAEPRSKTNTCGLMSTRKGQAASVTLLRREQLRSASAPTRCGGSLWERADRVVRPYRMLRIRKKPLARHHQDSVRRGVRRSQLHCASAGAAKAPYSLAPSSFPNCDRCAGSQFGDTRALPVSGLLFPFLHRARRFFSFSKKRMGAQKYFKVLSTKECGMLKPELLKSV